MLPQPALLLLTFAPLAPAQNWRDVTPDESDRSLPCRIEWQRDLADAETLSRATGKPILICVNMDGEPASEVFALRKYRQESFAALTRNWIPLIASPNRHTPRDHDERGRRIPCPRFGTVTCGEHIAIEPQLYERYFGGKRYAPRHLGVSSTGETLFDLFLNQNLSVVDEALLRFAPDRVEEVGRASLRACDARAREADEARFLQADVAERMARLRRARSEDPFPVEILRLALHDPEARVRARAAEILAVRLDERSMELVSDALASGAAESALRPLRRRVAELATSDAAVRRSERILGGLEQPSRIVDPDRWMRALHRAEGPPPAPPDLDALYARLEELDAQEGESDALERQLEYARTHLDLARATLARGGDPSFFLIDAQRCAEQARDLGAKRPVVDALLARTKFLLSEFQGAAEHAARALPSLSRRGASREAAEVLAVFARCRTQAIYDAESKGEAWPAEWLADADAAFSVLVAHPAATPDDLTAYSRLLAYLGLEERNGALLLQALERFPLSGELHERFRDHVWRSQGPRALEAAYEQVTWTAEPAAFAWFRGYAALVVAEELTRREHLDEARAAYERAIGLFEESERGEEAFRDTADHFIAQCQSGLAFLALERQDWEEAQARVLASLTLKPDNARSPDGLGRSPALLIERLHAALQEAGSSERAAQLRATIAALDPDLVPSPLATSPRPEGVEPTEGSGR